MLQIQASGTFSGSKGSDLKTFKISMFRAAAALKKRTFGFRKSGERCRETLTYKKNYKVNSLTKNKLDFFVEKIITGIFICIHLQLEKNRLFNI